ncbi:hypothetical protein COL154_008413 [Colletotrichum chrysophilum]|uniref:uncharacterized protein n=1 Tax=Colletotrichum chrysophilum TaxID=1836956 RepID=UPI002301D42C|nr:uncharacterized protein COL26b_007065 [Colletotrichum chrysophilum]KAJ0359269.1 hypothetical protein COL154_008413 [Colletotrichum chrysophilum]KAJ0374742.1 hypothetical protein COL26b_007065 [Colletotrichum chrysophilum]
MKFTSIAALFALPLLSAASTIDRRTLSAVVTVDTNKVVSTNVPVIEGIVQPGAVQISASVINEYYLNATAYLNPDKTIGYHLYSLTDEDGYGTLVTLQGIGDYRSGEFFTKDAATGQFGQNGGNVLFYNALAYALLAPLQEAALLVHQ